MRKTLRNIIASGVIASALTLGACTPAYHGRLIERRENIPTFNDSAERWQAFRDSIDERAVTKRELGLLEKYNKLGEEEKRSATKDIGRLYENAEANLDSSFNFEKIKGPIEKDFNNGVLTFGDLIYTTGVIESGQRYSKEQKRDPDEPLFENNSFVARFLRDLAKGMARGIGPYAKEVYGVK